MKKQSTHILKVIFNVSQSPRHAVRLTGAQVTCEWNNFGLASSLSIFFGKAERKTNICWVTPPFKILSRRKRRVHIISIMHHKSVTFACQVVWNYGNSRCHDDMIFVYLHHCMLSFKKISLNIYWHFCRNNRSVRGKFKRFRCWPTLHVHVHITGVIILGDCQETSIQTEQKGPEKAVCSHRQHPSFLD